MNDQGKESLNDMSASTQTSFSDAGITREMVLARFIRMCESALSATIPREAAAIIVNRISEILPVDRAVLVGLSGRNSIRAVTGGGEAAGDSAFADVVDEAKRVCADTKKPVRLSDIMVNSERFEKIRKNMGGTEVIWVPLTLSHSPDWPHEYALWLERWRGRNWEAHDIELLRRLSLFLGHALVPTLNKREKTAGRWKKIWFALAFLILMLLPVTSSVTAPVFVVPDRPYHVFAPMDGILKELYVRPGNHVNKGQTLFRYDARVLEKYLEEARRNVAVARVKLQKLEGASLRDPQARAELPAQRLEVERALADVKFYADRLSRAEVKSGRAGIVVLEDPDALIGAALKTGQAVLSVADPDRTKLKIYTPVSDVGFVRKGANVRIRLDSDPLSNLSATVTRVGFEIVIPENHVPSLPAEAIWTGTPMNVQPGQKGAAKIYGKTTILGLQLLRKPIIAILNLLGL